MRVMAFTPTYGDALRPETAASVVAQRWGGTLVWEVGRWNPFPPPDLRNVYEQYARGRALCLAGGCDALWTVEHDMVLPADALAKLWEADAPVAYGAYMLRHGSKVLNAWQWTGGRNLGMSLTLHPAELEQARRAGVAEVSGVGFGCTLIRREVLERIAFRPDGEQAPDIPFARDCLAAGVRQVAHFGVLCGHVHGGEVLTVESETGRGVAVAALQSVTVGVAGQPVRLEVGRRYTLPRAEALELARAGYVTLVASTAEAPVTAEAPGGVERAVDPAAEGREQAVGAAQRRRNRR